MTALHEEPATVEQLAGAMNVLGFYTGRNAPDEHEERTPPPRGARRLPDAAG